MRDWARFKGGFFNAGSFVQAVTGYFLKPYFLRPVLKVYY